MLHGAAGRRAAGYAVGGAALLVGLLVVLGGVGGSPASATATPEHPVARVIQTPARRPGSFLSLVPACGCAAHTEVQQFSLTTGRLMRRLDSVAAGDLAFAKPVALAGGRLLLTFVGGPRCAVSGVFAECPTVTPDSCVNVVESLRPGQGPMTELFTVPGREAIGGVVPSRDGSRVAFAQSPCTRQHGLTGLYVRDRATSLETPVMTRANACDGFGPAAWNRTGSALVFPYDAALGPAGRGPDGTVAGCPNTRSRLAVASLTATGAVRSVRLIAPDRGCAFGAAAFDTAGLLAAEGCRVGSPRGFSAPDLGDAFLVQLTSSGRVTSRIALQRGLESASIVAEPRSSGLLVTQDQPANNGGPEDDWVWEYNHRRLRSIAHYPANDAAQIIAVAW